MRERPSESFSQKRSMADVRQEIAELLNSGHAVSSSHARQILISQGLSPFSMPDLITPRFEELTGIPIAKTRYKGINVYYDPRLDLERDTNFSEVRNDIDQKLSLRAMRKKEQDFIH